MALRILRRVGTPYVYDMDSSMSHQIVDKLPLTKCLLPLMRGCERRAVRGAVAVAAVCDALADQANGDGARKTVILRDVPLLESDAPASSGATGFGRAIESPGVRLLYVGNLEPYQGIDLLIESFGRVPRDLSAQLVIVGGTSKHVARYQALSEKLDLAERVQLIGPRPLADLGALMKEADILVSPRIHGTNTPMKIYSYMAAGKAILATDLFTHTQVLDQDTACLAAPTPAAFSAAMVDLIADPAKRCCLGAAAHLAVQTKYSLAVFQRTLNELYDGLTPA
jgi:glycosyltransferase involved in cell wall biosynthesis